jgi:serine/threonine-protein kinase RsbW
MTDNKPVRRSVRNEYSMVGKFRRDIGALDEIFDFVERFVEEHKLAEATALSTKLAVEELFTNLVRHNGMGREAIEIDLAVEGRRLVVGLRDFDVDRMDFDNLPPPGTDLPLAQRKVGGLGIHLVKSLFDTLTYEYSDRTLFITAVKNLEDARVRD